MRGKPGRGEGGHAGRADIIRGGRIVGAVAVVGRATRLSEPLGVAEWVAFFRS